MAENKVLHLVPGLDIGGLERVVFTLCEQQKRKGWEPFVYAFEKDSGSMVPLFQNLGIPTVCHAKGRGFSWRLPFQLLEFTRRQGIQLIHSHDLGSLIYATIASLLSFRKLRVIHTQHSFQHLNNPRVRFYERLFPHFAQAIACVSEEILQTYEKLGQGGRRLRLIPNGVCFANTKPARSKLAIRQELLRQLNRPLALAEKKWVLYLGRISKKKGALHLAGLWKEAAPENAELFLVGPESEEGILGTLNQAKLPHLLLAGPSLQSSDWLLAADVFLSASELEGLPMAVLEAAAQGLPTLLSEIPGHERFRGWAYFFPLSDPKIGANLLNQLLAGSFSISQQESARALARLEAECGAERMVTSYLDLYKSALANSGS